MVLLYWDDMCIRQACSIFKYNLGILTPLRGQPSTALGRVG